MESLAAVLAGTAAGHTIHNDLVLHLDGEGTVDLDTHGLHGLGLGDGPGHAVKDVALLAVFLGQPLLDDADNDIIRNQLACFHIAFGLNAHRGACLHGGSQDVAGGYGGDTELAA